MVAGHHHHEKVEAPEYKAGSSFFTALFKECAGHVGGIASMELWYKVPACPTGKERLTHCHLRKTSVTCDPLQLHSSWSKGQSCSKTEAAALKRIADHAEHGEIKSCLPGVGLAGIMAAESTCNSKNSLEWRELWHLVNDPEEFVDEHAKDAAEAFHACAAVDVGVGGAVLLVFEEKLTHKCKDTTHSKPACKLLSSFARALAPLLEGGFCHSIMEDLNQHKNLEKMSEAASQQQEEEDEESEEEEENMLTFIRAYMKKMAGATNDTAPRQSWREAALTWVGVASFLLLASGLNKFITDNSETYFLFMGSLGALSTLLFAAPNSPLVQPRNIIGGSMLAGTVSILFFYITSEDFLPLLPKWVAMALAPATAIAMMAKTGLTHPPAGAICLVFLGGSKKVHNLSWQFLIVPVLATCVMGIMMALLVNNLSPKRQYPISWGLPAWFLSIIKKLKSSPPRKDLQVTTKEAKEKGASETPSKPSFDKEDDKEAKAKEKDASETPSRSFFDEGGDTTKADSISTNAGSNSEAYRVSAEAEYYSEASSQFLDV